MFAPAPLTTRNRSGCWAPKTDVKYKKSLHREEFLLMLALAEVRRATRNINLQSSKRKEQAGVCRQEQLKNTLQPHYTFIHYFSFQKKSTDDLSNVFLIRLLLGHPSARNDNKK